MNEENCKIQDKIESAEGKDKKKCKSSFRTFLHNMNIIRRHRQNCYIPESSSLYWTAGLISWLVNALFLGFVSLVAIGSYYLAATQSTSMFSFLFYLLISAAPFYVVVRAAFWLIHEPRSYDIHEKLRYWYNYERKSSMSVSFICNNGSSGFGGTDKGATTKPAKADGSITCDGSSVCNENEAKFAQIKYEVRNLVNQVTNRMNQVADSIANALFCAQYAVAQATSDAGGYG